MQDSPAPIVLAKEFCDSNAEKVDRLVAFLASAKVCRVAYGRSGADVRVGLRSGRTIVEVWDKSPLDNFLAWTLFLDKAFKKFGLDSEWRKWRNQRKRVWGSAYNEAHSELKRRGGSSGLAKLSEAGEKAVKDKKRLQMMRDALVQADLNRSLAFLRKARASGATVRQMNKLIKTVLAEEAMREVQES